MYTLQQFTVIIIYRNWWPPVWVPLAIVEDNGHLYWSHDISVTLVLKYLHEFFFSWCIYFWQSLFSLLSLSLHTHTHTYTHLWYSGNVVIFSNIISAYSGAGLYPFVFYCSQFLSSEYHSVHYRGPLHPFS